MNGCSEGSRKKRFNKRGAEAKVYFSKLFGIPVVIKVRDPKGYRIRELDESLRAGRTRTEGRSLLAADRNGVNVPKIFHAGKYELVIERKEGKLMKDSKKIDPKTYRQIGKMLAKMHGAGITHGDFTPANVMLTKEGPSIIDFGLAEFSKDSEERAIDLLLMKRSIGKNYAHFFSGYKELNGWKAVLKKLEEVETRGRYHARGKKEEAE